MDSVLYNKIVEGTYLSPPMSYRLSLLSFLRFVLKVQFSVSASWATSLKFTRTHIHTDTHTCTYIHTQYIYTHTHVLTHIHPYTTYMYRHTKPHIHICTYKRTCTHTYTYIHTCIHYTHIETYIHAYTHIETYIHAYTHIHIKASYPSLSSLCYFLRLRIISC